VEFVGEDRQFLTDPEVQLPQASRSEEITSGQQSYISLTR
jgi:hypothetical protein